MNVPITLFSILMTVAIYIACRHLSVTFKHPLVNIVFLGTAAVIAVLSLTGISYGQYTPAKDIMTFLLGPATIALALPLYYKREILKAYIFPVFISIILGVISTVSSIVLIGKYGGLDQDILVAISTKSVTTPIAIEIARIMGGDPGLAVAFVAVTGTFGSMMAFPIYKYLRIVDPVAQGLAIGTLSHGQGAALALMEGQTQGAMGGIAMALAAIVSAFIVPLLLPLLL
jgi:putative effector of murein hydrolase